MKRYKETEYFITENGDVYRNNKILKKSMVRGYYVIAMYLGSRSSVKQKKIHRLVAETYLSNDENYPQVNHKNGDKLDNRVENLEWCNSKQNNIHRTKILKKGIGENHYKSKLTEEQVQEIRNDYVKYSRTKGSKYFADKFDVSISTIHFISNERTWRHLIDEPVE
jgi:hypothetical protein